MTSKEDEAVLAVAASMADATHLLNTWDEFTDPRNRTWQVKVEWGAVGDRAEIVGITIMSPINEPATLTKEILRAVPLAAIDRSHREVMSKGMNLLSRDDLHDDEDRRLGKRYVAHVSKLYEARRGVALGAEGLEAVAAVWRQAHAEKRPVQRAVADAFGIARGTAANRILAARRAGLIPPTGRNQ